MEAGGDRREPVGVVESSGGRGLLRNLQQETLLSVQSRGASRDSRGPWQRTPPPRPLRSVRYNGAFSLRPEAVTWSTCPPAPPLVPGGEGEGDALCWCLSCPHPCTQF